MKRTRRCAAVAVLFSTLLWTGCYDTSTEESPVQLVVGDTQERQVGEAFWVDVRLDGMEETSAPLTSVNFTLHYTNSHVRLLEHEAGALAEVGEFQALNYPSNAEVDVGVTVDSAQYAASASTLARFRFQADDVTTDEAPAYLSFSNITAYDAAGNAFTFAGAPTRVTIQSAPGSQTTPELRLFTQYAVKNQLTAKRVTLDQPGWVVVRTTDSDATASTVVGRTWVEAGTHQDVIIELDEALGLAEKEIARLEATLHHDTGTPKQFEYNGSNTPDPPVQRGSTIVAASFFAQYTDSEPESSITVRNQQLTNRTFIVDEVVASEPADMVIHRGRRDRPFIPGIIGKVRVAPGTNRNVEVPLFDGATVACGETLWPMLHVRSESSDQPYEIDHPLITQPATVLCDGAGRLP